MGKRQILFCLPFVRAEPTKRSLSDSYYYCKKALKMPGFQIYPLNRIIVPFCPFIVAYFQVKVFDFLGS